MKRMRSPRSREQVKRVYPVSLGCPKNKADFEKLLHILWEKGYEFTLDPQEADLFWINTCAFIRPSVEESLEHIFELGAIKRATQKLIVSGCLIERYGEAKLKELLPEVDEFYGIEPFKYFVEEEPIERLLSESPFYAYLKITEGCSHRCSYCTIPKIRGPFRSRPFEKILEEAKKLLDKGVKELILVGQDTTIYLRDKGEKRGLVLLLKKLAELPYDFRIRILYMHPSHVNEDLIKEVMGIPKVVPYFDLPIQHAHPEILKAMRRSYSPEKLIKLVDRIREINPLASIRTSIIVGFPGEGEKEFNFLLEFLKEVQFDYLGVFLFYPEEGTLAEKMVPQVSAKEKNRRKGEILKLQKEITKERLRRRVGLEEEVLVLGEDERGRLFGISKIQAPEIDGVTYIIGKESPLPGCKVLVKIKKSGSYDLWGEVLPLSG